MKRVISGILTSVLIAVTVGVPVFKHTCHVFDRSEVSLLSQDECCDPGSENSTTKIDVKCCSLEQYDTSLEYETLVKKNSELSIGLFVVDVADLYLPIIIPKKSEELPVLRPPPLANRDLLKRIQVYLI